MMPLTTLHELINLAHQHSVYVSTGGWIEYVSTKGPQAVDRYIRECRDLGFDMVEVSAGFISMPPEDMAQLVKQVKQVIINPIDDGMGQGYR